MQALLVYCPLCGRVDAVQKVSAIIAGYETYRMYTKNGIPALSVEAQMARTRSAGQQGTLSEQLSLPERRHGWLTLCLLVSGLVLTPTMAVITWFSYRAASDYPTATHLASMNENIMLGALCVLITVLLGMIRAWQLARERPRRERAMTIWNTLYYCHRDDTVFAAENPHIRTTAKRLHHLLGY